MTPVALLYAAVRRFVRAVVSGGDMSALSRGELEGLVEAVVASYRSVGTINHLGHEPLPDRREVIAVAEDLKEILFPGYHRHRRMRLDNAAVHIGSLMDSVHTRLTEQAARAFRSHAAGLRVMTNESAHGERPSRAEHVATGLLRALPGIRGLLASDVAAAFAGDPAASTADEVIFCYPGLEAITVHRIANMLYGLGVPVIPRMLSEWSHSKTGIDIHPGATIGPRFFIDHGTGVVIGETCEIGEGVTIYQSVTLGAWSFPRDEDGNLIRGRKRHPTIGNDVVIYSNATILGGSTTIGANSTIGAGVCLSRSVPPNTVVTVENPQLRFREAG